MFSLSILLISLSFSDRHISSLPREDETCSECHGELLAGEHKHKAMKAGCSMCHEASGAKHPSAEGEEFSLTEKSPDLCYLCHDDNRDQKYQHKPVKDCMICHTPHNGDKPKLLLDPREELCQLCHTDIAEEAESAAFPHKPLSSPGGCLVCHSPHSSDIRRILVAEDRELCISCHDREYGEGDSMIVNIKQVIDAAEFEHSALKGGCSSCHLPHGSEYPSILVDAYPQGNYAEGIYENYALCLLCHDSDLLEAESTTVATNFRDGDRNMHYLHSYGNKGRNCHLCHNVHAAPNNYVIENEVKYGAWNMNLNFEHTENGGSCMPGCHSKYTYNRIQL